MSNFFLADTYHGSLEVLNIEEPILDILRDNLDHFFAVILVDKNFLLDHSSLVLDDATCKFIHEEDSSIVQNFDGDSAIAEVQDLIISNDSSSDVVINPSEEVKDKLDLVDVLTTNDISDEESSVMPIAQEEVETADVVETVFSDISEEENSVMPIAQQELKSDLV